MPAKMDVFAEFSVEQVLPFLARKNADGFYDEDDRQEFDTKRGKVRVRINSIRLRCFARSLTCVGCGLVGEVFRIEHQQLKRMPRTPPSPHLNLYARRDGELVLMTKDHIIPSSKGGNDCLSNLQTMCHECNSRKGSRLHPLDNPLGRITT